MHYYIHTVSMEHIGSSYELLYVLLDATINNYSLAIMLPCKC